MKNKTLHKVTLNREKTIKKHVCKSLEKHYGILYILNH